MTPEEREALRARIAAGDYAPDPRAVAAAILARGLWPLPDRPPQAPAPPPDA